MSHNVPLDAAKMENVMAMTEATREYGLYHQEKVNIHRIYDS
jgi:hypothetical protein